MSYQQIAKLYLRGSLCNKTLKGLSEKDRNDLDNIINIVFNDPNLQHCRKEFCNALRRTIKNEYVNQDVGEQDYRIAIMKAAVAAAHGWAGKEPALHAIHDPIQRKKWFQTWIFNYLRQILRENKLPIIKSTKNVNLPADEAAIHAIKSLIESHISQEHNYEAKRNLKIIYQKLTIYQRTNESKIFYEYSTLPIQFNHDIEELNSMYLNFGVRITCEADGIVVKCDAEEPPLVEVSMRNDTHVKACCFDADNEDQGHRRDQLEMSVMTKNPNTAESEELLQKLKERLPADAGPILEIYDEDRRPEAFINKFGQGTPKITHIATFLNKSPKEVKRLLGIVKIQCMALRLGY